MPSIKELRRIRCISQADLAKAIGVTIQTIWFWENGYRLPGHKNRQKLHDLFGVTEFEFNTLRKDHEKDCD